MFSSLQPTSGACFLRSSDAEEVLKCCSTQEVPYVTAMVTRTCPAQRSVVHYFEHDVFLQRRKLRALATSTHMIAV